MATLDDKLLGEKLHNYCSSSEDEEEEPQQAGPPPPLQPGQTSNTGPKGVIKDWQRYKQLQTERREEAEREKVALAHKLSLTCKTVREEEEEKKKEQELEEELQDILEDDFMKEYMQKRMAEMMAKTKRFGELVSLKNGEEFLNAVDNEEKAVTVIILIQEPGAEGCAAMLGCCHCLARDYSTVKFCEIAASAAGLSKHFKVSGVPALLVYRGGQLVTSFVRLTDQLGEDFFANDLETFLLDQDMLPEKEETPKIIRGSNQANDSDSD